MASTYLGIEGQSYSDIVLNTYGSLDFYAKFLDDNNLSPEDAPYSGQVFTWDETLVVNQAQTNSLLRNNIKFSTLSGIPTLNQNLPPNAPPTPPNMAQTIKPIGVSYTATTDGESVVTLTELQGAESIVQIEKELKPLKTSEFVADLTAGTITLVGDKSLAAGETLFIIYNKIISI